MAVFYIKPEAQVAAGVITPEQVPAYMDWVAQQMSGPVALGEPLTGWQAALRDVVTTVFSAALPELPALLHTIDPEGHGVSIEEGLGNVAELAKQPAKELAMAWADEWGFDSGTFQDVFTGVQNVRNLMSSFDEPGTSVVVGGGGGGEGGVAAAIGGAAVAGGMWLGSVLTRMGLSAGRGAIFAAANGVKVRMAQLWPYVRRYGPTAVATGLGIGATELATLLMQPAAMAGRYGGGRRRRRGISARDVTTTKRTLGQIRKLCYLAGMGRSRGRSGGYRPRRRRSYGYYR